MTREPAQLDRRSFLRGSLATAALVPFAGTLASCSRVVPERRGRRRGRRPEDGHQPVRAREDSSVEAVIFNGGYGYDYVKFAADQVNKQKDFSGVTIKVSPSTQIAQQLQPRFVGGNPPDLIDNSGANAIGFNTIAKQLETLDDVFEANNYEGTKISDTLYPNVKVPGTFDGKFVALNYVMTVYGIWYSASLFKQNGWTAPATWDEALDSRRQGQGAGQVPLRLGQGGGDVLPDDGRQLRHQGGRRRGPAGAGEPQAEVLVSSAAPERLPGPAARWCRRATSYPAGQVPSSPPPRRSGATTNRRSSTRRAAGSRTR